MKAKKRIKREISLEIELLNAKIGRLGMEIGQDSAEYIRTNDEGLKRSLDLKVQQLSELQEKIRR